MGVTRAECEAEATAEVGKYMRMLGLDGWWMWRFKFVKGYTDDASQVAECDGDIHQGTVTISFDERVKRSDYATEAAHEVLHLVTGPAERAARSLEEPAQTLLLDTLHQMVYRLAWALSGKRVWHEDKRGQVAPWEEEAPAASTAPAGPVALDSQGG